MHKTIAQQLFASYHTYKLDVFSSRRFTSEQFHAILDSQTLPESLCSIKTIGHSLEGRPIRLYSIGNGKKSVLLWSQMHGDESTATMAIADILNYCKMNEETESLQKLLSSLQIHFLPILNPDGAARFQRRTAQGIDMNRDALALRTPEATILRNLQHELKPDFGFNLHDQELSTIGGSKTLTQIALLAPAYNEAKEDNEVRLRAKHLNATFAEIMKLFIPNAIARYDDSFEPRAFGDTMQKWGTSTMLVESGHALNDTEKWEIRKLNAVGILSCLFAISSGSYENTDIALYSSLPTNGKKAYDVIIRNVTITHENGAVTPADIAVSYQVDTHTEETPILVDMGDLHTYLGLREYDGRGKEISSSLLRIGKKFLWENMV